MDELEFRLARRDFLDHLEDILEKDPQLKSDPVARHLIEQNALARAQQEIATHGRLIATPRQYAKEAVAQTKRYLAGSRQAEPAETRETAPAPAPAQSRKAKAADADADDRDYEEMSNSEYAKFFRNLGANARSRTPAGSREGDE